MDRIEKCLRRAEAAEKKAERAQSPDIRQHFLEIAREWRDLAWEAEWLLPREVQGRWH